jgi:hypothetical protein
MMGWWQQTSIVYNHKSRDHAGTIKTLVLFHNRCGYIGSLSSIGTWGLSFSDCTKVTYLNG